MEVAAFKKGEGEDKDFFDRDGFFIRVSKKEAYRIIFSLSQQMYKRDNNSFREEMYTDKGEYFTIVVTDV